VRVNAAPKVPIKQLETHNVQQASNFSMVILCFAESIQHVIKYAPNMSNPCSKAKKKHETTLSHIANTHADINTHPSKFQQNKRQTSHTHSFHKITS
jgi:hypothetical protein